MVLLLPSYGIICEIFGNLNTQDGFILVTYYNFGLILIYCNVIWRNGYYF